MTVTRIVKEDNKFYNVTQKYKYNNPVKAIWTNVSSSAPSQWRCEMKVFNADDEFFVWEDIVSGYTSTATEAKPIKSKGSSDEPIITNAGTPIGSLRLAKTLSGTDSEKYYADTFWFKVTMKKSDNTTPYTMLPFDSEGVAYFEVKANAADEDKILISGIPAGCKYTVEEVTDPDDTDHPLPKGYTKVTAVDPTGTVTANTTSDAEIVNRINTVDLTLTKSIELWKKAKGASAPEQVTDSTDSDYADWADQSFTFTVRFRNLVKGKEYTYLIDDVEQTDKIVGSSDSADTELTVTIKGGQTVKFKDIPVGTTYTVTENTAFESDECITYETSYSVTGGNNISSAGMTLSESILDSGDDVTFTNKKTIDESLVPEKISVTVDKQWYTENGEPVNFTVVDGKSVSDPAGNYPSFIKVYLGRALKLGDGDDAIYTDVEPGYSSLSMSPKSSNPWRITFDDLDKYGEVTIDGVKTQLPYVYFLTEVEPTGFHNINEESEKTAIGTEKYFVAEGDGDERSFVLKNKADPTFELSVCKLVTGNMGNKTKDFTFEIDLSDPEGQPLIGTGFTILFTDVYDPSYSRNRTYTIENGKIRLTLPHGKMARFLSLPEGTRYTITETTPDIYGTMSGTYTGNVKNVDISGLTEGLVNSGTLNADVNYLYANDLTAQVPTGIKLTPFIVLIVTAASIGFVILFITIKKKKDRLREDQLTPV